MNTVREKPQTLPPLLETRDLSMDLPVSAISQRTVRIIDNINMEVKSGSLLGIIGESGSGKTTLARCCLWLLKPTSGLVYFDGQDLASLKPASLRAQRRELQMIFQDSYASLNPAMTVEEILLEPFQVHKNTLDENSKYRVADLLNAVFLDSSLLYRRPGELSGGQQQRIVIARGLALKPRLLIADEPVSALDASVQAQILNLLADLKKQYGFTLILISHSLYAVNYLCDQILVMYRGKIVEEAPASVFFNNPRHPYSQLLLNSVPEVNSRRKITIQVSNKAEPFNSGIGSGCVFYERCSQAFSTCREQSPPLKEMPSGGKVACFLYSNSRI